MTNFDTAIEILLEEEGGWIDDPADKGGETNFGLSARQYPELDLKNITRVEAVRIYLKDYWDGLYDLMPLPVAVRVFILRVHTDRRGPHRVRQTHRLLQRACNRIGASPKLVIDGILGRKSMSAIVGLDPERLVRAFRWVTVLYYIGLIAKDRSQTKFLINWVWRASY